MRGLLHIAPLALLLFLSCNKFEYNPYQLESNTAMPVNLNAYHISQIKSMEALADDTIRFVYTGDSQRKYERLEDLVSKVNTLKDVDFFVICGDIADFGMLQEYLWIQERLADLNTPYICVIGNHDFAANNGVIYERMFGAKNFSMHYKGYKFLFHDTNSREYNFNGEAPHMDWLSHQILDDTHAQWMVGLAHVPPYDNDFDAALEMPYKNLLAAHHGFILALYGHRHSHSDSFYYNDQVRYMTSNSVDKDEFVLIEMVEGQINKKLIPY